MISTLTNDEVNGPALCGFYKTKMVRRGPFIPVRIFRLCACSIGGFKEHEHTGLCDRHPLPTAQVNGKHAYIDEVWGKATFLRKISKAAYDYLLADIIWCEKNAPKEPKAAPQKVVNLNEVKPLF